MAAYAHGSVLDIATYIFSRAALRHRSARGTAKLQWQFSCGWHYGRRIACAGISPIASGERCQKRIGLTRRLSVKITSNGFRLKCAGAIAVIGVTMLLLADW